MSDPFDPMTLTIEQQPVSLSQYRRFQTVRGTGPVARRTGRFLKGPIPMAWLAKAAKLPGHALHVALAIRHQSDLEGNTTVALRNKHCKVFGVDRDTKRRGLAALEATGLVLVNRKPRRNPIVTIVDI
jgi:hypothetical protein